jgi:hypothetical protein
MKLDVAQWRTLSALLDRALELDAPARDAWLGALDGSDAALAPMLRDMLARETRLDDDRFLATLASLAPDDAQGTAILRRAR